MRVVTISAEYGAGGSIIAPQVAQRLGLPFVDRAIPEGVARDIGCSLESALAHDGKAEHGLGRLLAGAARLPNVTLGGMEAYLPVGDLVSEDEFVVRTEKAIREVAATTGGVLLGRAAVLVLKDVPYALHVRIYGPKDRRLARVMRTSGIDEKLARHRLEDADRARTAYVKHFYRADPTDCSHYHLTLDSTVVAIDDVVEIIVRAAQGETAVASSTA
ncbi:MAG: cytidylate kinase-like family protein [Streptosporangiales bacterium]|nr:cytidylate kinase-like family protein [Streptosporangiales bacterium]